MDSQCNSSSPLDIQDIEDLFDTSPGALAKRTGTANASYVIPKVKKKPPKKGIKIDNDIPEAKNHDKDDDKCFLPGQAKIFVKTWGCSHNVSDGEYMAGILASQGYTVQDNDKYSADLWILNSCTVKNPSEDHFRNDVQDGLEHGKKVIVAGCVPQGKPDSGYIKGLSVIGVQQIDRVVEVVEETLKGNQVRLFGPKKVENSTKKAGGADLALPKIRKNPLVEIIPINTGCLNSCTYCKTKHARGQLGSYSIEEICSRAVQAFEEGKVTQFESFSFS